MVDKQGEGARGQPATSAWSVPEGAERMSGVNALLESQNIAIAPHLRSFFALCPSYQGFCTFGLLAICGARR